MFFIFPWNHDQLVVSRLPFVTFALILVTVLVFIWSSSRIDDEEQVRGKKIEQLSSAFARGDWVVIEPAVLAELPVQVRELHELHQAWLRWLAEKPEEAAELVRRYYAPGAPPMIPSSLEAMHKSMQNGPPGGMTGTVLQMEMQRRLEMESDEQKAGFLYRYSQLPTEVLSRAQDDADRLAAELKAVDGKSILKRLAYVPAKPKATTLVTYAFLHAGILHLVVNLVFLWLAAVKLEDLWSMPVFIGGYVVFAAAGALTHGAINPTSDVPLVGASGAVAGLMGAFLVRLYKARINFVYFYILGLHPRYGSFEAPAWLMLPLWAVSELFSGFLFQDGPVAHWAHVGGFAAGIAVALAFKFTSFEQRVLGREPEVEIDPATLPLVALQNPPPVQPAALPGPPILLPVPGAAAPPGAPKSPTINQPLIDTTADALTALDELPDAPAPLPALAPVVAPAPIPPVPGSTIEEGPTPVTVAIAAALAAPLVSATSAAPITTRDDGPPTLPSAQPDFADPSAPLLLPTDALPALVEISPEELAAVTANGGPVVIGRKVDGAPPAVPDALPAPANLDELILDAPPPAPISVAPAPAPIGRAALPLAPPATIDRIAQPAAVPAHPPRISFAPPVALVAPPVPAPATPPDPPATASPSIAPLARPVSRAVRLELAEVRTQHFLPSGGLAASLANGQPVDLSPGRVAFIAFARLDRIDPDTDRSRFSLGLPQEPAYVLALVEKPVDGPHASLARAWLVDASKAPLAELLPRDVPPTVRESALPFARALRRHYPQALWLGNTQLVLQGKYPPLRSVSDFIDLLQRQVRSA